MIPRILALVLVVLVIAAAATGWTLLHQANQRLRRQIAAAHEAAGQRIRQQQAEVHAHELAAQAARGDAAAQAALHQETGQLRAQIASLENTARQKYAARLAQANADSVSLASHNRDPERGMVRPEDIAEAGQATPAAAVESLIAAAFKGNYDRMAAIVGFPDANRPAVDALMASLSPEARATYPTPGKLAALFLSDALTNISSVEIAGTAYPDPTHATVSVRGVTANTEKFPLQLGPDGWQLMLDAKMVRSMDKWVHTPAPGK